MGRRRHEDEPDTIKYKIRRLEKRLEKQQRERTFSDGDVESDSQHASLQSDYESSEHGLSDSTHASVRSMVVVPEAVNVVPEAVKAVSEAVKAVPEAVKAVPEAVNAVPDALASSGEANKPEMVTPLSNDILEALGESKEKDEVFGPKIREEISKRWGKIIMEGLGKEQRQKLLDNTLIPENFQLLKAPKLNQEISSVLTESSRNRDKRLEKSQNHLGIGIAAITNLLSSLIDGDLPQPVIIKKLSETGQVLLDLHCQNTANRRKLVTFSLDKKFLNIVSGVKRDTFLFGENLGDKIKASKTAERSGLQIKRTEPQPSTSHRPVRHNNYRQGNSRRPLRHQNQRGRSSGHRTQAFGSATGRHPTLERYNLHKMTPKTQPKQQ